MTTSSSAHWPFSSNDSTDTLLLLNTAESLAGVKGTQCIKRHVSLGVLLLHSVIGSLHCQRLSETSPARVGGSVSPAMMQILSVANAHVFKD